MEYISGDKVRIAMGLSNDKLDLFNAKECVIGRIHSVVGDCYFVEVGDEILIVPGLAILSKVSDFTKEDLKPGMVVEFKNGECAMILPTNKGLIAIEENNTYTELSSLPNDLNECNITRVYGLSKYCFNAHKIGIDNRELLWERKEPKYKVGDKFFFEELSEIERPRVISKLKVQLYNVMGEIKKIEEGTELINTKYRIKFLGYKEEDIGIALFDDYILDNYGKKINC